MIIHVRKVSFSGRDKKQTTANGNYAVNRPERGNKKGKLNMNTINLTDEEVVTLAGCIVSTIEQNKELIEKFTSYGLDDESNRAAISDLESEIAKLKALLNKALLKKF